MASTLEFSGLGFTELCKLRLMGSKSKARKSNFKPESETARRLHLRIGYERHVRRSDLNTRHSFYLLARTLGFRLNCDQTSSLGGGENVKGPSSRRPENRNRVLARCLPRPTTRGPQ